MIQGEEEVIDYYNSLREYSLEYQEEYGKECASYRDKMRVIEKMSISLGIKLESNSG